MSLCRNPKVYSNRITLWRSSEDVERRRDKVFEITAVKEIELKKP
jgi:hypothetical protein